MTSYQLTIGEIYVCHRDNKRIQIFLKEFKYISKFGEDSLSDPRDIKLSKDYIYVLDESNPCVYLFDYDHILQKRHITRGNGMLVSDPYFFFIDDSSNLPISDYGSNILIFLTLTLFTIYSNLLQFVILELLSPIYTLPLQNYLFLFL